MCFTAIILRKKGLDLILFTGRATSGKRLEVHQSEVLDVGQVFMDAVSVLHIPYGAGISGDLGKSPSSSKATPSDPSIHSTVYPWRQDVLGQRRRRLPNISPAWGRRFVQCFRRQFRKGLLRVHLPLNLL